MRTRGNPIHSSQKVNHAQDHPVGRRGVRMETNQSPPGLDGIRRTLFGLHLVEGGSANRISDWRVGGLAQTSSLASPVPDGPSEGGCYGLVALEAGEDKTVAALGSDGSDAGDDAGIATCGVGASVADFAGSTGVVLLHPRSAAEDRRSADTSVVRMLCPREGRLRSWLRRRHSVAPRESF